MGQRGNREERDVSVKLVGVVYTSRSGRYRWRIQAGLGGRKIVSSGNSFRSKTVARRDLSAFCRDVSLSGVRTVS